MVSILKSTFKRRRITHAPAAKYYNMTKPVSRNERASLSPTGAAQTRERWRRIGAIANRAGSDDTESDSDVAVVDEEERSRVREHKRQQKKQREQNAKVMGLEYFLEMVDHKHRYGSNLRRYHVEWKKSDTNENFFYWLDCGEGKNLDLEDRPRSRLDTELVRYLSPEERRQYMVKVGKNGRFIWDKNNIPVTTSTEFKDSIDGIVPMDDETPTWREVTTGIAPKPTALSDTSSLSGLSSGSEEDATKYVNADFHDAKGLAKVKHLNADALTNHMLRKTTKKNTWIFVVDTSFRMFIGIKQSGAFQHSSFLRGARVSAAGQIKIKRGQIRKISPLSGHYAPPLKNFKDFLRSLEEEGADLSALNVSRSYAVLLGLEGYLGAKKQVKIAERGVRDMWHPQAKREREEAAQDKSRSAQREREIVQQQELEKRRRSFSSRLLRRLKSDGGEEKPLERHKAAQ